MAGRVEKMKEAREAKAAAAAGGGSGGDGDSKDDDPLADGYVAREVARTETKTATRRPTVALGAVQGTRSAAMKGKEKKFLSKISKDGGGSGGDGGGDEAAAAAPARSGGKSGNGKGGKGGKLPVTSPPASP
jgi:hypothetical protein